MTSVRLMSWPCLSCYTSLRPGPVPLCIYGPFMPPYRFVSVLMVLSISLNGPLFHNLLLPHSVVLSLPQPVLVCECPWSRRFKNFCVCVFCYGSVSLTMALSYASALSHSSHSPFSPTCSLSLSVSGCTCLYKYICLRLLLLVHLAMALSLTPQPCLIP